MRGCYLLYCAQVYKISTEQLPASLVVEEEDESEGYENHGAYDYPKGADVGDEGEVEVHAEDARNDGERKKDGIENGE